MDDITKRAQIVSNLRMLWLRSRERAQTLKRDEYTCKLCGKKQSKRQGEEVKVQVDHIDGIDWDYLVDEIYRVLLIHPDKLQTLCKDCHHNKHHDSS